MEIIRQLQAVVTANTVQYDAAMGRVETRAAAAAAKIKMAGMMMAGAFAVVGAASLKMAVDFEKNMANVNTLLGGNSKRIKELGEDVKRMARDTGKGLDDLTGGLYQVISAFGDTADSTKLLEISAKAGVAGLATTKEAIDLISAVTKGYGDTSAEAAQKAADLAFITVKLGQTTFPELAATIGRTVPLAAKLGVTVEELHATFATLTGVTGNTAEVSTQVAGMMRAFIKPTKALSAAVRELGYSGAEALVSSKGLVPAMKLLLSTTDGSVEAAGKLFRRAEAMTGLFALTGGQAEVFAEKLQLVKEASGAATEAFEIQASTTQNRLDRLVQSVSTQMTSLGEALLPMAETVISWAEDIIRLGDEIRKLFKNVGEAATDWIPDWLKKSGGWLWQQISQGSVGMGRGWAQMILAAEGIDPRLADPEYAQRANRATAERAGVVVQGNIMTKALEAAGLIERSVKETAKATEERLDTEKKATDELREQNARYLANRKAIDEAFIIRAHFLENEQQLTRLLLQQQPLWDIEPTSPVDVTKGIMGPGAWMEELDARSMDLTKGIMKPGAWMEELDALRTINLGKIISFFGTVKESFKDAISGGFDFFSRAMKYQGPSWGETLGGAFTEGFKSSLHNIGDLLKALAIGLGDMVSSGLDRALFGKSVQTMFGEIDLPGILGKFGETTIGKTLQSFLPVGVGFLGQALMDWVSGPTNEELMASQGAKAGEMFGEAWTDAAASKMQEVAEKLPLAKSGKWDVAAAMVHPDTLAEVIRGATSMGAAFQATFAEQMAHGVNRMVEILGITLTESFQMMAPVFEQFIGKAIEFGNVLDDTFLGLLEHARNLGVEINVPIEKIIEGMLKLGETGDLAGEKFDTLLLIAQQLGFTLDEVGQAFVDKIQEARDGLSGAKYDLNQARRALDSLRYQRAEARTAVRTAEQALLGASDFTFMDTTGENAMFMLRSLAEKYAGGKGFLSKGDITKMLGYTGGGADMKALVREWAEAFNREQDIKAQIERQKESLRRLRDIRKAARNTVTQIKNVRTAVRDGWSGVREKLGDLLGRGSPIIEKLVEIKRAIQGFQSGGDVQTTGLYQLHAGERVLNAVEAAAMRRGELDTGGKAGPQTINLVLPDGRVLASATMDGIEEQIYGRKSRLFSDTIRRRGVK